MNQLSTQNFVMVLRGGARFFLNEKEAELVRVALKRGDKYLEIGGSIVSIYDFSRLVSGIDYEEGERIRKGERKCSCGQWIPPYKTCASCE